MQTIIINPKTLAELKSGSVNGVSPEMANYIEENSILTVEIHSTYVGLEDAHGITSICDLNQTIFDCSIL